MVGGDNQFVIKDCSGEGSLGNWEYDEVANKKSPYVLYNFYEQPFKLVKGIGF